MTGRPGSTHVGQHGLRVDGALGSASPRDDAVGAVEAAAVLHLHVCPCPIDPSPAVRDPLDLDPGERRQGTVEGPRPGPSGAAAAVGRPSVGRARPEEPLHHGQEAVLLAVAQKVGGGIPACEAARSTATEQPVTRSVAPGLVRRARRTALRDLSSATAVTVQVLTRWRSAAAPSATTSIPRSRRSRSTASISAWFTLQPRFVIAARRITRPAASAVAIPAGPAAGAAVVPLTGSPQHRLRDMRKAMNPPPS